MNHSPLQLDTNCFQMSSHYYPSYYSHDTSAWSTSLLCPSTPTHYPSSSSMPTALQSIENYCATDSFYPSASEPLASSSESSFDPSLPLYQSLPPTGPIVAHPSSHIYPSEECSMPSSTSSTSATMMLPQNRANYTRHQLIMLNEIFKEHKYPNSLQKTLIAKYIGVSRDQIRIWFQNKRRKVQLINKGQAKQTKTDVECEYGEYRRHLPKNFLNDLFQDLYKARGAPARLPVKRENSNKTNTIEAETMSPPMYYSMMPPTSYYPTDDSSHGQQDEQYSLVSYPPHLYSDRL